MERKDGNRRTVCIAAAAALALSAGAAEARGGPPAGYDAVTMAGPTLLDAHAVTPEQAHTAPLGAVTSLAAADAESTAKTAPASSQDLQWCSQATWKYGKGTWPYGRRIYQQTYWCYYLGRYITYRRTGEWTTVDPACGTSSGPVSWKIGGGVGYSWVTVHTQAEFACDTPWWFKLHDALSMDIAYNSWGNSASVG